MPYSNAPEIVDGALRFATTHPTLKFLNIAGNISTDLLIVVAIACLCETTSVFSPQHLGAGSKFCPILFPTLFLGLFRIKAGLPLFLAEVWES
ncbi:hypothetical protein [Nostoc sp.]|uniref:hypothetical protein n=1 Tax=Nostoc sp. TaxID=1180 RepID=UPI002FF954C4